MEGGIAPNQYQIYQEVMGMYTNIPILLQLLIFLLGNYLRFVNHSCKPNCRFQKFSWLGLERILLVSCGVETDNEITVDYSDDYWNGLDKVCLCGNSCCRYPARRL